MLYSKIVVSGDEVELLDRQAIGRRDRMIAYAKAARRVKEQAAQQGQFG